MPFITFIYKKRFDVDGTGQGPYFGKYYTNSIENELYIEVKKCVIKSLNEYIIKRGAGLREKEETVSIGVLSVSSNDIMINLTNNEINNEIQIFNFYRDYHNNIYINGNMI